MLDLMPQIENKAPGLRKVVLIIDDEQPIRRMVGRILQMEGFQPVEAPSAAEGIALARQYSPDLVVCDIIMEAEDGFSVLEALRREPALQCVPFIFMTGTVDNDGMRRSMKLGADDYLAKPFSTDELLGTVAAQFRKQALLTKQTEKRMAELRTNINMALPHELLTPLNGIMGFAELLKIAGDETPVAERQGMASSIAQSAERLQSLIENYLVYAQIELLANDAEKLTSLRESVCEDSKEIISLTAEQIAKTFQRTEPLSLRLQCGAPRISSEHLRKIVQELTSNACKFSKPGSLIEVVSWTAGEAFILGVRDRGHGMTPEQIAQVGAFMQFDRRCYEQQGLGLGLIICRRLAELHGGELRVMSQAGHGAEVIVSLPNC